MCVSFNPIDIIATLYCKSTRGGPKWMCLIFFDININGFLTQLDASSLLAKKNAWPLGKEVHIEESPFDMHV